MKDSNVKMQSVSEHVFANAATVVVKELIH